MWHASTSALPVDFDDRKLVVAFAEPADDAAVTAIGAATGYEIIPAVADRVELARAIDMIYGVGIGDGAAGSLGRRRGRSRTLGEIAEDELHVNELLELVLQYGGSDLHLTAGSAPVVRVHGDLHPMSHLPTLERLADPPDGVLDHLAEAAREVRERTRARHVVRAAGQGTLPRQRVPAARLRRLRDARDPVRDHRLRPARRAAGRQGLGVPSRAASCS